RLVEEDELFESERLVKVPKFVEHLVEEEELFESQRLVKVPKFTEHLVEEEEIFESERVVKIPKYVENVIENVIETRPETQSEVTEVEDVLETVTVMSDLEPQVFDNLMDEVKSNIDVTLSTRASTIPVEVSTARSQFIQETIFEEEYSEEPVYAGGDLPWFGK
ncbi:MAG: uncharacterized protein KVP18_004745, partial [Porospora cf. gigantea A]|uniref:uncharacterized protein n=1 Tax=Porospora cf. gigantea A TaxID=2853593 RepID=UPI00355AB593